jgi:peroxiredoxin
MQNKGIFIVLTIVLMAAVASPGQPYAAVAFAAQEGTQAPGFNLRDLKGNVITLEQYTGKVVLLVFWAPWCVPCRDELPELDRLYKKYGTKGLIIVGIAEDASTEMVVNFLEKVSVSFPLVIDRSHDAAEAYRLSNLPSGYLIARDGVVERRYRGSGRDMISWYEKDIEDLLKRN